MNLSDCPRHARLAEKVFTHLTYMVVDDDHRLHKTAVKMDWKSLLEDQNGFTL